MTAFEELEHFHIQNCQFLEFLKYILYHFPESNLMGKAFLTFLLLLDASFSSLKLYRIIPNVPGNKLYVDFIGILDFRKKNINLPHFAHIIWVSIFQSSLMCDQWGNIV